MPIILDICPPLPDGSRMVYLSDGKTGTVWPGNRDKEPEIGDVFDKPVHGGAK